MKKFIIALLLTVGSFFCVTSGNLAYAEQVYAENQDQASQESQLQELEQAKAVDQAVTEATKSESGLTFKDVVMLIMFVVGMIGLWMIKNGATFMGLILLVVCLLFFEVFSG